MGPDHCLGNLVVPTIRPEMTSPAPELVRVLSSTPEIRKDTPGYFYSPFFSHPFQENQKIMKEEFCRFYYKIFWLFLFVSTYIEITQLKWNVYSIGRVAGRDGDRILSGVGR